MATKASPVMHSLIMSAVLATASPALAISPGESTHGQVQVAQQGHAPEPATDSGLSGLAALANQGQGHVSVGDSHWAYEGQTGPVHWGDLSTEFGTCSAGQTQSPIDLDGGIVAASTPPCSEGVNWFVLTTPIQASFTQIMRFAALVGPNARPVQAVRNRLILMLS